MHDKNDYSSYKNNVLYEGEGEFTDEIDKFKAIIRHVSTVAKAVNLQVCLEIIITI
jgi:hypothetical protein